jgi:hypothetical protein
MRAQIVFMLVVVFLLSGCGYTKYKTAEDVYTKTIYSPGPDNTDWVKSPPVEIFGLGVVSLRTRVRWGIPTDHQLYLVLSSNTRAFPLKAYDVSGNQLKLEPIDYQRDVIGVYNLQISIEKKDRAVILSRKYLLSATKSGLYVKCVGIPADKVITLEPHYVEGYLKKCRELTSKSCEEGCKKMFEEGTLRQGMTVEECTKVSCL